MSKRQVNTPIALDAGPATSLIDERSVIHLRGLPPRASVTLRAFLLDPRGTPWSSRITLYANVDGRASIDCDELTSSLVIAGGEPEQPFDSASTAPLRMEIAVELCGRIVASTQVSRQYLSAEVRQTELSGKDRSGTLFESAARGPRPGGIVMGGSSGGLSFASQAAASMGERVMQRLAARAHPFRSRHLHYRNAGHLMRAPSVSTQILHGKFAFGGEPRAQAQANRASWTETLSFLSSSLGMPLTITAPAVNGGRPCR